MIADILRVIADRLDPPPPPTPVVRQLLSRVIGDEIIGWCEHIRVQRAFVGDGPSITSWGIIEILDLGTHKITVERIHR